MKRLHIIVAAALIFAGSSVSMAQSRALELGHEATASDLRLPTSPTGELTMQGCATCKVLRLRATTATRYEIGDQPATLVEITKYLEANKNVGVTVMQRTGTFELSRLVVWQPKRAK
jgi:hypothetical protein